MAVTRIITRKIVLHRSNGWQGSFGSTRLGSVRCREQSDDSRKDSGMRRVRVLPETRRGEESGSCDGEGTCRRNPHR